jgi:hypothetical protein
MNNWIPITIANVYDIKVGALVVACQQAALASGQTDPSPRIIQEVIDRIRAEVAGCRTNAVDSDLTTIPKSLMLLACRMIMRSLKDRLEIGLTEQETKQWSMDETYLVRISHCEVPIDLPDNPIAAPVEPHAAIQIANPGRRASSESWGGLL